MAGMGAMVSSAQRAVVKVMRVMLPVVVIVAGLAMAAPARGSTTEIIIPVESVIRGPEGTVATLATVGVDPDLQGSECTVSGVGVNQDSIHPNTDILVSSGGGQVVLPDVEREPNFVIVADGTLVLGPEIVVEVRFGPDRVFSGGLDVVLTCTTAEPPPEVSVSVVAGVCVPETNVTPVVVVIDPAGSATVTIEGPGGPFVVSEAGGTVEVGPGEFTWSAVAADDAVLVGVTSGAFTTVDCSTEEPPPEVCDAALGDYVWFDTNADGIQQPDEVGVSGVSVELLADGQVVATTLTDADGLYRFVDLCAGAYQVVFELPDIPAMENETWSPSGVGDNQFDSDADSAGRTSVFDLGPGENDLTWDAGLFAVSVSPTQITPPPTQVATPPAQTTLPDTGLSTVALALLAAALMGGGTVLVRRGTAPPRS